MREAVELEATERIHEQGVLGAIAQKLGDYFVLSKARLSLLVLSSGLVGFWLASGASPNFAKLSLFGVGALLVIAGRMPTTKSPSAIKTDSWNGPLDDRCPPAG